MTPKGQASEEIAGSQQVHDEDTTPGIAISEFDESLFDHVNVGFFWEGEGDESTGAVGPHQALAVEPSKLFLG
jgi:hypothetical protein